MSDKRKTQRSNGRKNGGNELRIAYITDHNLQGNYFDKIMKLTMLGALSPEEDEVVHIYHDEWCGINKGRRCNCDPWIRTEPL